MWLYDANVRLKQRFTQIVVLAIWASLAGMMVSGPRSTLLLGTYVLVLLPVGWLIYRNQRHQTAVNTFLIASTALVAGIITLNQGVYDPMMMGFVLILVYTAYFATRAMFFWLLVSSCAFCIALVGAMVLGYWQAPPVVLRWESASTVLLMLALTGVSAWFMARDFKVVVRELQLEASHAQQASREIERLSRTDPLTGLNTRSFAAHKFTSLSQQSDALAVLFIDFDNFKPINDTFGHSMGDKVLAVLAQRIDSLVCNGEISCRFGGDEFVLILRANAEQGAQRAAKLLELLSQDLEVDGRVFRLSASIGIALSPEHAISFGVLCRQADLAMYQAKYKGKNSICVYQPEWDAVQLRKQSLRMSLRQALARHELYVVYQLKFIAQTKAIMGVEALLRWRSPEHGEVKPNEFIPLAKSLGLYTVAEGVESAEALATLQSLQCDCVQGFFLATPMPEAEVTRMLQADRLSA